MSPAPEQRSVGELIGDLTSQSAALVRKEVELLRVELDERIDQMQIGLLAALAGGGAVAAGVMVLLFGAVFAIGGDLPLWAAALIVGSVAVVAGTVLLMLGRKRMSLRTLKPERAIREAKATTQMIKEELT